MHFSVWSDAPEFFRDDHISALSWIFRMTMHANECSGSEKKNWHKPKEKQIVEIKVKCRNVMKTESKTN